MSPEERRALIGDAAIQRAREIAAAAPPLSPELYQRLAILLRRSPKRVIPVNSESATQTHRPSGDQAWRDTQQPPATGVPA